jgi:topoisomerase IA-like protein
MASSTIHASNVATRFQKKVNREYVREGRFGPYIGKDVNAIIQVMLRRYQFPWFLNYLALELLAQLN